MLVRLYQFTFLVLLAAISYQWMVLNKVVSGKDLFNMFSFLKEYNRSTEPGRPISLFLGYTGFTVMCLTNLYIMRKKFDFMKDWGNKLGWLDFHIFCGMLGPVFIIFHTNFKIGGLVAISFWSMVVSAVSGIVGKVFYTQIIQERSFLIKMILKIEGKLQKFYEKVDKKLEKKGRKPRDHEGVKSSFVQAVGVPVEEHDMHDVGLMEAVYKGFTSGMKFSLKKSSLKKQTLHPREFELLTDYAFLKRRVYLLNANKKIMGHWHTFHKPFAIFMYVVAIIHIITALLFQVKH